MHHHGLVKILIQFHLRNIGDTWEDFLVRNNFQKQPVPPPKEENVRRSKRNKTNMIVENRPETSLQRNDEKLISEELTEIRKQIKARGRKKK